MKKIYMFVILLGILIIVGCSNNELTDQIVEDSLILSGDVKEINIKAFRFGFEPNTIRVNKGDKVKITAESIDIPHGLAIEGYDVNLYLDGVRPKTIEFIADKTGTFTIYCSVVCGSGHSSMRGKLIVE